MTSFDIAVLIVLGFSLIFSLMKGFVREIFSLLAYVGGYLMAVKYQGAVAQVLMESIPSKPIAKLISFVAIFIITSIIISLMGRVAKGLLWSGTDLSMFDRILGGLVGLARGVVILVAIMFPLQFFPKILNEITQDSYTSPYLNQVLSFVNKNPGTLNIRKQISDFDLEGTKKKLNKFKDLSKLSKQIDDIKESVLANDKPLDQYTKEDKEKLSDILRSVEKE